MSSEEYQTPVTTSSHGELASPTEELIALPIAESITPAKPSIWAGVRAFIRETIETVVLTLIIFVLIRAAVQNFRIEGYSMEPNFHDGQYLLVSKFDYVLRQPQRGDVIVFNAPQSPERDFIKRVIGLPGETVEVRAGKVFINGQPLQENYRLNPGSYSFGPQKVGDEQLFVLGDNRNHSSDSHSWGMLPLKDIIGKAWITYWPPEQWGFVQTASFASDAPAKPTTTQPAQAATAPPQIAPTPTTKPYP